jgi:hypothetical protein
VPEKINKKHSATEQYLKGKEKQLNEKTGEEYEKQVV